MGKRCWGWSRDRREVVVDRSVSVVGGWPKSATMGGWWDGSGGKEGGC